MLYLYIFCYRNILTFQKPHGIIKTVVHNHYLNLVVTALQKWLQLKDIVLHVVLKPQLANQQRCGI